MIDPKPLVGERAFGIAAFVRGPELGRGRAPLLHRLDRLTADLGIDRERARGWCLAHTLAWAVDETGADDDMIDGCSLAQRYLSDAARGHRTRRMGDVHRTLRSCRRPARSCTSPNRSTSRRRAARCPRWPLPGWAPTSPSSPPWGPTPTRAAIIESMGVRVVAAKRAKPQTRVLAVVDPNRDRTLFVIGENDHPTADDPLPWDELAGMDGVYFTGQDPRTLQLARAAPVVVVTARRFESLRRSGIRADALVGSGSDRGEQFDLDRTRTAARSRDRDRTAHGAAPDTPRSRRRGRSWTPTVPAIPSLPGCCSGWRQGGPCPRRWRSLRPARPSV